MNYSYVKKKIEALWEGSRREGWIIYINASVSSYGSGWSFTVFRHSFCIYTQSGALPICSIFTAEDQAIKFAIQYSMSIEHLRRKEIVEIRSDSQLVIRASENTIIVDLMLSEVKNELRKAGINRINIVFRWVPSLSGIDGNDMVDKYAKTVVDSMICSKTMWVKRDLKISINKKNKIMTEKHWELVKARVPKLLVHDCTPLIYFFRFFSCFMD